MFDEFEKLDKLKLFDLHELKEVFYELNDVLINLAELNGCVKMDKLPNNVFL